MRKTLLTLLQIAVTGGLLWWVFHDRAIRDAMAVALSTARKEWLIAAMVAYIVVEFAAAFRWQVLLKVQNIHLPFSRVIALSIIGMFYNLFLPGGTGGDIVKTYLLWKETPNNKPGALLAVLFDRMIGLVALIVLTGIFIGLRYQWLTRETSARLDNNPLHDPRSYVWFVLAILAASILGLLTTFIITGFNLLHRLPHRFPGREKLIELSAAYHLYAKHWKATTVALVASAIAHVGTFATFFCVAHGFRESAHVALLDFFSIMPIERTISSLPISLAGVGTREFVLQVMLFNLCQVGPATARLIGMTSFLVLLICCLPGGVVYFFYKPSGATAHVKLRDMKQEVATLEHEIAEKEE
ncbi:MAG: lysylphosphatidylglycerol synthase transmembrane domain-containing protein [Verrucomicrobiota bacterium]